MRVCDLTHAYTETSGGIRTTIDAKRRYVLEHTDHEHVLIAPGAEDRVERHGRATTVRVAGPVIPGAAPYRFFLRADKVRAALAAVQPDLIELQTFYTSPWAAFSYRKLRPVAITAFYHTDLPSAYVYPAVSGLVGERIGRRTKAWAEAYVCAVFDRCDRGFAVSDGLVGTLRRMGIATPLEAVPLGVDLDLFHPARRDPALRERLGIASDTLLLVYAGRLDSEKEVHVLAEAVARLLEEAGRLLRRLDKLEGELDRSIREPTLQAPCHPSADCFIEKPIAADHCSGRSGGAGFDRFDRRDEAAILRCVPSTAHAPFAAARIGEGA